MSFTGKLRHGFRGAFVELFDRTSHWMFAGLLISALITVLIPAEVVTRYLSSGPVPLLVMLVIGIPMYICASGSTPIAAALVLKGLSPGAALVFLLAGPATNIGSLAILTSFLGRRVTAIYLSTIVVLSLALGGLLDVVHRVYGVDPQAVAGTTRDIPLWLSVPAAVVFAVLLFFSFRRTSMPPTLVAMGRGIERLLGIRITRRGVRQLAIGLVVLVCAATFFFTVPTGYQGLVRRFGAPTGPPRGEGLHLKWPPPIETVELVRTDVVRRVEIGFQSQSAEEGENISWLDPAANVRVVEEEAYYLTGDENIIDTRAVVQYRVVDPERYLYGFSDPESVMKMEALTQLIENLAQMRIDGVYTDERRELETRVIAGLERRIVELDLGIELLHLGVVSAHAPPEVHAAFRDVASAQEDKQTAINVAYRYHDETINLAEGEAAGEVESARSYANSQIAKSQGESQSLIEKARAYRERPVGTYTRLYLETMEQVLARGRKIIRPGWTGAGSVDLWISNGTGEPMSFKDVLAGSGATVETGSEDRSRRE
jgi:HflK protein